MRQLGVADVVEAHHRDVGAYPPAGCLDGPHRPDRGQVRGGEHRVQVGPGAQQFGHRPLAAGDAELAVRHQVRLVAQPGRLQRRAIAGQPVLAGAHVQRAGDGGDGAPADLQQVLGGQPGAAGVVGVDVVERLGAGQRAAAEHGRHRLRLQLLRQLVAAVQGQQQHPVHVATGGVVHEPPVLVRAGGHREDQLQAGLGGHRLGGPQHAEEERVGEQPVLGLGDQERHRVAAPGHQRAGGPVGGVGDVLGGGQHRDAGPLADVGRPAQYPARGRPGHPGPGRHLLQGGQVPAAWGGHAHERQCGTDA